MATSNSGKGSQSMVTSNSGEGSQSMVTSNSGEGSQSMATSNSGEGSQLMATSNSGEGSQSMANSSSDLQQSILASDVKEDSIDEMNWTDYTKFLQKFCIGPDQLNNNQEVRPSNAKEDNPVTSAKSDFVRCTSCVSMAMTEKGSSYLIGLLDKRMDEIQIYAETFDDVFELMTDEYGHLVFMKLVVSLDSSVIHYILKYLIEDYELLISASLYKYGIPSVLKLIEVFQDTPSILDLTKALGLGMYTLLTHENGKHVVLKCITLLTSEQNDAIYVALNQVCSLLGMHEVGYISLCMCIDALKSPQKDHLLDSVLGESEYFSYSPFGVHVLNHVMKLEEHHPGLASEICSRLKPCISRLSRMRKGSKLLQTCLRTDGIRHVIEGLLATNCIFYIARDIFGVHLIQTALEITRNDVYKKLHSSLLQALLPYMEVFKFHPGKVLYDMIKSEVPLDKKLSHKGKS